MQLRDWTQKKEEKKSKEASWEVGSASSRVVGPSLMAINGFLVPFVPVSVVNVVVVSVLMLRFFISCFSQNYKKMKG